MKQIIYRQVCRAPVKFIFVSFHNLWITLKLKRRGVLVFPNLQLNSQKLGVQAPQNLEFEQVIAMLKCENLPRTNSTKYETHNILVKFQQNEHTPEYVNGSKEALELLNYYLSNNQSIGCKLCIDRFVGYQLNLSLNYQHLKLEGSLDFQKK